MGKQAKRRKDVKYLSIYKSKLTVGVKHSMSSRTTLSPNLHLVEEGTCFSLLLDKLLLFVAFCHKFFNRASYDGFVVSAEIEL